MTLVKNIINFEIYDEQKIKLSIKERLLLLISD